MIHLNIGIGSWPWARWKHLYGFPIPLTRNKTLEWAVHRTPTLVGFGFDWHLWQDHAGISIDFDFLTYGVEIDISDNRHWNHTENRWCTEDEF